MAISKNDAPFTYSGSWDITEYSSGRFYARFLTSGTLSPKKTFSADVFIVGGGGAGGGSTSNGYNSVGGGGGGGGGYTNTLSNRTISSNTSVVIGAGGVGDNGRGYDGEASSFGGTSAAGGKGGDRKDYDYNTSSTGEGGAGTGSGGDGGKVPPSRSDSNPGSSGGSGSYAFNNGIGLSTRFGAGGGGGASWGYDSDDDRYYGIAASGGSGGTTGGGMGGGGDDIRGGQTYRPTNGAPYTGAGGGGGCYDPGGDGGTGIVIIRGVLNLAPTNPDGITYSQPNAGKPLLLSTGGSTDPEGNPINYVWEHRTDSGVYSQIGVTTEPQVTATVPTSGTTYQARVKAVDDKGAVSGYTTGIALPINYYQAFVGGVDGTPIPILQIVIGGNKIKAGWVNINGEIKGIPSI